MEDKLGHEAGFFNDIIQFDFNESYYNLTLKSVAMLRWTSLHCSKANFIFKVDNDAFIRVNPFLEKIESFSESKLYGPLKENTLVMRAPKWKLAIDKMYYPQEFYPPFLSECYLIPAKEALELYAAIEQEPTNESLPALPFEDVYVTGILAKKAELPIVTFSGLKRFDDGSSDKSNFIYLDNFIVFYKTLEEDDFRKFWKYFGAN